MNHRPQQSRSSSHGRKAQHARPAKPAALSRRGHSYSHAHPHSTASSHDASGTVSTGRSKKVGVESDEDEVDMESFLQFCATCERQIITPGASILYCSESCRRKDSQSQPTCLFPHKHSPVLGSSMSYFDHHPHHHIIAEHTPDIIPQRCPTVLRPLSLTYSDLMISESGSPTDTTSYDLPSRHHHHHDSSTWADVSSPQLRPQPHRRSTNLDLGALPSLIHSPSSSLGSPTCTRPFGGKTSTSPRHSRPAPTHLPADSTTAGSLKSTASTLTSFRVVEGSASHGPTYEKRRPAPGVRSQSEAQGSLKQLFGSSGRT